MLCKARTMLQSPVITQGSICSVNAVCHFRWTTIIWPFSTVVQGSVESSLMHSRVFHVFISFKVIFIFLHIKKIGLDLVSASADMVLVVISNHMYGFQLPLMCDINIHKTIQGTDRNSDKCLNHSWFGLFAHVHIIILLLYFLCSNYSIVSKESLHCTKSASGGLLPAQQKCLFAAVACSKLQCLTV